MSADLSWVQLDDEALLHKRICELGLTVAGTELEPCVSQLHAELAARGLSFFPPCYLGDEWFCPDLVPIIAIPFYLAHPRLKQLEAKMMLEVEGGTAAECMRLLRHEAGHAINYAYRFFRRRRWKELFGDFKQEYPETYHPHPYSRLYVRHLDQWYAQCHPDEDFAETFAVWLQPDVQWREHYQGWKALEKLEYVDWLMKTIAGKKPPVDGGKRMCDASLLRTKLATYYQRKRRAYEHDLPGFYDRDLRRLFSPSADGAKGDAAALYIRKHRTALLKGVARWSGESKFMINRLLKNLMERCRELDLRASHPSDALLMEISSYLTTLALNYRHTGKFVRIP